MRDLDFDLSRSLQVKSNAAIWKSIHDFLFNFNGNYGPICKRFQVTALRNMRDLDFDLSRSLQVKANAAIWKSIHDFLFNFNGKYGPICKRFEVTALRNMRDLDLTSPGHSRSKPMPPFERASMTSYSTLMVTMDLSASFFQVTALWNMLEMCLTSIWPLRVTLG